MFNNSSHESVGGQPTYADTIDFKDLVISLGYKKYFVIKNKNHLKTVLKKFIKSPGPSFLEVKIVNGSLNYLQRPKNLVKIKDHFIKKLMSKPIPNSKKDLDSFFKKEKFSKIFIICGKNSFSNSGAEKMMKEFKIQSETKIYYKIILSTSGRIKKYY